MDPSESDNVRAARRRETYEGGIVKLGEDKPPLYAGKSPIERFALHAALVERVASLAMPPVRIARADWPGEVFNIDERNSRFR